VSAESRKLSSGTRLALVIVLCVVVVFGATVGVVYAKVFHAGTIIVEVDQPQGDEVSIAVPASIVPAALSLVPASALRPAIEEARPWVPALTAAWDEIVRCPDVVLVQVDGPGETVEIAKRGKNLVIHVVDGGEEVHISIPVRTVSAVLDKLERAARA
jgi:hypothetical protein